MHKQLIWLDLWFWATLFLFFCAFHLASSGEREAIFHTKTGLYLGNYALKTTKAENEIECEIYCLNEPDCVSANFKAKGNDKGLCELNSKTLEELLPEERQGVQLVQEYNYLSIVERSCKENEEFITETKKCKEFFISCKEVLSKYKNSTNGIYSLKSRYSGEYYDVYCHMTDNDTCGGGGWTLAAKIDGTKNTFTYDSPLWTNKEAYAIQDGLEGLSEKESKMASYWNTPFTKICLGMSKSGVRKWIKVDQTGSSLYDVIADGQFRGTTAGRPTWKSLIADSSLQRNCNREGLNSACATGVMRIGIFANNENGCTSCDSWIGFGVARMAGDGTVRRLMVCGNKAAFYADNGSKTLVTFGYVLVQ